MIGQFLTTTALQPYATAIVDDALWPSHIKFQHVRRKRKEIDQSRSNIGPSKGPILNRDWSISLEEPILDRDWSIFLRLHLTCLWNFMCDGHYSGFPRFNA